MTRVADEAYRFVHELVMNKNLPALIRQRLMNALQQPSPRETDLRNQIAIVRDGSATNAARIAAMERIISYSKGDL